MEHESVSDGDEGVAMEVICSSDEGAPPAPDPPAPTFTRTQAWRQDIEDRVPLYTDKDMYDWWQTGTPLALIRIIRLVVHTVCVRFPAANEFLAWHCTACCRTLDFAALGDALAWSLRALQWGAFYHFRIQRAELARNIL